MTYAPSPIAIESAVQWAKNTHADPSAPLDHMIAANVIKHNYPDMFDTPPSKQAKIGETWVANHAIYGELVVYRGDFPIPEEYGEGYWNWATVIDGETDYLTDTRLTLVRKLTDPHSSADETDETVFSHDSGVFHSFWEIPNMETLPQGAIVTDATGWELVKIGSDTWEMNARGDDSVPFNTGSMLYFIEFPVKLYIPF